MGSACSRRQPEREGPYDDIVLGVWGEIALRYLRRSQKFSLAGSWLSLVKHFQNRAEIGVLASDSSKEG